jgi:leader peptidase (prepilin peptidase)/N-methyltransferase
VELGTGLLTGYLFYRFGWTPILPVMIVYCSALIAIGMIDLKDGLIFPAIVFPVALVALVVNFFIPNLFSWHNFLFGLIGAAFGSIFLLLAFFLSKIILKKEGMGLGDVYMAAMMGLMVGFPNIIVALFGGIILGGLTAIFLVSSKKKSTKDVIPFGDFLAIGTVITLLWGTQIMHWYLHLAHFE